MLTTLAIMPLTFTQKHHRVQIMSLRKSSSNQVQFRTSETIDRQAWSQNASRDAVPASVDVKSSPTERQERKGILGMFKGFLSRSAEVKSTFATASGIPSSTVQARDSGSLEGLKESKTTPEDKIELSATSPISCRKLTEPIPIQSTIFGASAMRPPSLAQIMPSTNLSSRLSSSAIASHLARYPRSSPATTTAWISHYKKELHLHKPDKLDGSVLSRLFSAWLRIQSWSDVTSEESIRLAAQIALFKAHEHISRHEELNVWQNERIAAAKMGERSVFEDALDGNRKLSYVLTELQDLSSQAEERRLVESKTTSTIKLNEDTQIAPADSGAASVMTPAPSEATDDQASIREEAMELRKDVVPPKENRQAITVPLPSFIHEPTSRYSERTMESQPSPSFALIHTNSKDHTPNIDP